MQDLTEQQQTGAQTQLDSLFATADSEIAEATTGDASVTIFGNFVTEANSVMDSYQALDLENAKDKAKGRLVAQVKATTEKINSTDYLDELTKQSLLAKLDGAYALAVANIDSVDTWSEKFMVNEYFSRFMKVVDEINAEIDSKIPAPDDNSTANSAKYSSAHTPSTGDVNLDLALAALSLTVLLSGAAFLRFNRSK